MALLQRLSWLVPLPRMHLSRYHGVFAPNHPWRRLIVKKPRPKPLPDQRCAPSRWIDWAALLRRVFLLEVLVCSTCGGERRPVQVVKEGPVARKILEHLGLPTEVTRATPYRPKPELWDWNFVPLRGTGPPSEFDQRSPDIEWDQRTASDLEASF